VSVCPVVQDEDEFPDLATGGAAQRNKPDPVQPKLPKTLVSVSPAGQNTLLKYL